MNFKNIFLQCQPVADCKHNSPSLQTSVFSCQTLHKYPHTGSKHQKGAAMVEVAIAVPLFFTLIFGVVQFGWLLNNYIMLNNAALVGAREFAKQRGYTTPRTVAVAAINAALPTMNQSLVTITTSVGGTACATDTACVTLLGNATTAPASNAKVTVTLSYTFNKLISGSLAGINVSTLNTSASAVEE